MNILAFAASNSQQSINHQLVAYACDVLKNQKPDVTIKLISLNDFAMPIYSIDIENDTGIPPQAKQFLEAIEAADALIISFAEHNGSYTAAYKNVFDWASRIEPKVYQDKPAVLLATSPGAGGAQSVLNQAKNSAPHFKMEIISSLSVPNFHENFDQTENALKDGALADALADAVKALIG